MPDQNDPVTPASTPTDFTPAPQPAMQTPPPAAGQQPPAYAAAQQFNPQAQPTNVPDRSTMYIVLSVLEFLFCGGLLAIIPFVFSMMYKSAYNAGNMIEAASKEKNARISLIVILIVGIVVTILSIIMLVMMMGAASYSTYSV